MAIRSSCRNTAVRPTAAGALSTWRSFGLLASVALVAGPVASQTLPSGASVAAGSVSISTPSGTSLIVDQASRNAIVNWQSFSIGAGNSVTINNGSGSTLNRVTGNVPSRIDGTLTATGSVVLVNPAGVAVGSGGRVATGGSFVASTLDIPDSDFLKGGDRTFAGSSTATVTNAGTIGSLGGDVALIARAVENSGTIDAPAGTAALAAGYEVLVRDGALDGGRFHVKVGGADTEAKTSGTIQAAAAELRANGGNVYALAGNTGGAIAATGATSAGGRVFLTAGDEGTVTAGGSIVAERTAADGSTSGGDIRVSGGRTTVTGTLAARGGRRSGSGPAGAGGTVVVTGGAVALSDSAVVDASGGRGGTVLVGGDYQGGRDGASKRLAESVATARTTTVAAGARLSADGGVGGQGGDGGSVVVWSDEATVFLGAISARGSGAGGKGGSAEVSGKAALSFQGSADLRGESGPAGTLLLDPYNLTISSGTDSGVSSFSATGNDSVLNVGTLTAALATASVTISTGASGSQAGDITVAAPISWSADTTLKLSAAGSITVNAPITATGANAGLVANSGTGYTVSAPVTLTGANASLTIDGNSYTLLHSMADIDAIDTTGLGGRYALAQSLDAAGTTYTGPLVAGAFTGTFTGLGNSISNLTIDAPTVENVGLFGEVNANSALVRDLTIGGSSSVKGLGYVGGIVGKLTAGVVEYVASKAAVSAVGDPAHPDATGAGGLVGYSVSQESKIGGSRSSGAVSGTRNVGGLVGLNAGQIVQSSATGSVDGSDDAVGGLIGRSAGSVTISDVFATGAVAGPDRVGGLIGSLDSGSLSSAFASGTVSGAADVGGLIGFMGAGTYLESVYATGAVSGRDHVGGLVGRVFFESDPPNPVNPTDIPYVFHAYATGSVTASGDYAGGLIGFDEGGSLYETYATGRVDAPNADPSTVGGLTGYLHAGLGFTIGAYYSYWNVETTGQSGSQGGANHGTGLTTAEMLDWHSYEHASYTNPVDGTTAQSWDESVWAKADGTYLPQLWGVSGVVKLDQTMTYGDDPASASNTWTGTGWWNTITGTPTTNLSATTPAGFYALTSASAAGTFRGGTPLRVVPGDARVNLAKLVVTPSGTLTYGSTTPNYSFTASGWKNGQTDANLTGLLYTTTASATSDVGSVNIVTAVGGLLTGAAAGNYIILVPAPGTMTVTPRSITVTANPASRAYGDTNPTLTYTVGGSGLANGDSLSGTLATSASAASAVGTYTISQGTLIASPNYSLTVFTPGTLTVDRAILTIIADSADMTYGDAVPGIGFTTSGWKNTDTASLLSGVTTSAGASATSPVGSYATVGSGGTLAATAAGNYSLAYVDGTLTVAPRPLTVTAASLSRVYGDANPALGYTVGGRGLVNGDSLSGTLATAAGAASPVGTYGITQGSLAASANYVLSFVPGTLTVAPRPITVTADAHSRIYGDDNPALTYTVGGAGLVNGDSLSGALATAAGVGSPVDVYGIVQGTLAASANYVLSFVPGALTVAARPLTVTADDQSRRAGSANPPLTYSVGGSGLVNGDALNGTLETTAGTASPVGAYPILQGSLAASTNYALTYLPGVLSVLPAAVSPTGDGAGGGTGGGTGGRPVTDTGTAAPTGGAAIVTGAASVAATPLLERSLPAALVQQPAAVPAAAAADTVTATAGTSQTVAALPADGQAMTATDAGGGGASASPAATRTDRFPDVYPANACFSGSLRFGPACGAR